MDSKFLLLTVRKIGGQMNTAVSEEDQRTDYIERFSRTCSGSTCCLNGMAQPRLTLLKWITLMLWEVTIPLPHLDY